jgi:hypothetical protein
MAVGVIACVLWSLVVLPACLVSIEPGAWSEARERDALTRLGEGLARLADAARRRRGLVVGGFGVAVLFAGWAASHVFVQDSWVSGFRRSSAFSRGTETVNERFGGTHLLQVAVEAEAVRVEGTLTPDALEGQRVLLPKDTLAELERLDLLAGHAIHLVPTGPSETDGEMGTWVVPQPWLRRIRRAERSDEGVLLSLEPERRTLHSWLSDSVTHVRYRIDGQGRLLQPRTLAAVGELERRLASLEGAEVGRVVGPHEHLETMHYMLRSRAAAARRIPDDEGELTAVLDHYRNVRGEERLARVLSPAGDAGLVTVFVKDADFVAVDRLVAEVRAFEETELVPRGIRIELAGDLARSQSMVGGIVSTQTRSLFLGLAAVFVIAAFVTRSVVWGALSALPACFAVVADFALLGSFDIPLGVATSMFAGMTIAIGVDYAIHLAARYRRGLVEEGEPNAAWRAAHRDAGPAVVVDALALALAFGVLVFSRVPANARLGALMVASLGACLAASLLLLPVLVGRRSRG